MRFGWLPWISLLVTACPTKGTPTGETASVWYTDGFVGDDDDTIVPGDDDDDSSPYFDIAVMLVEANFGFDASTGRIVDVYGGFGVVPSAIGLYFGTTEWEASGLDFGEQDEYCAVFLPLTGASPASGWPAFAGLWQGFDYNLSEGLFTNCDTVEYPVNPNQWGFSFASTWASYGWGTGITDLWSSYASTYATGTLAEEVLGGYVNNSILPTPTGQEGYIAIARQIDDYYELVIDSSGSLMMLEADSVYTGTGLATGHYAIYPRVYWTFQ